MSEEGPTEFYRRREELRNPSRGCPSSVCQSIAGNQIARHIGAGKLAMSRVYPAAALAGSDGVIVSFISNNTTLSESGRA